MPEEQPAKQQKPRPHAHLTVEELRRHEHITDEEWFDELEARGIITPAVANARPLSALKGTLPPGALERFLKERG